VSEDSPPEHGGRRRTRSVRPAGDGPGECWGGGEAGGGRRGRVRTGGRYPPDGVAGHGSEGSRTFDRSRVELRVTRRVSFRGTATGGSPCVRRTGRGPRVNVGMRIRVKGGPVVVEVTGRAGWVVDPRPVVGVAVSTRACPAWVTQSESARVTVGSSVRAAAGWLGAGGRVGADRRGTGTTPNCSDSPVSVGESPD